MCTLPKIHWQCNYGCSSMGWTPWSCEWRLRWNQRSEIVEVYIIGIFLHLEYSPLIQRTIGLTQSDWQDSCMISRHFPLPKPSTISQVHLMDSPTAVVHIPSSPSQSMRPYEHSLLILCISKHLPRSLILFGKRGSKSPQDLQDTRVRSIAVLSVGLRLGRHRRREQTHPLLICGHSHWQSYQNSPWTLPATQKDYGSRQLRDAWGLPVQRIQEVWGPCYPSWTCCPGPLAYTATKRFPPVYRIQQGTV